MGLKEYHRKRDFGDHPRAARRGAPGPRGPRSFCVQKHAATRLHYDFRLEMEGVLKSWAVPKGPSFDPADKRLAMMTEDHPLDYGDFEGIIPAGEYGGGTVLLWDRGTWEPLEDPHKGLRAGSLKFRLDGEKLQGGWTLVKIKGRDAARRREELAAHQGEGRARAPGRGVRRHRGAAGERDHRPHPGGDRGGPRPRLALQPRGRRSAARRSRRAASRPRRRRARRARHPRAKARGAGGRRSRARARRRCPRRPRRSSRRSWTSRPRATTGCTR